MQAGFPPTPQQIAAERKFDVDLVKRAETNRRVAEETETIDEFIGSGHAFKETPSNWPPPLQMDGRPVQ